MSIRKFLLRTAEGQVGTDGKLEIPKGTKYKTLSEMVELDIRKGKRAGEKFIVTAVPKDTDRATVDQYIASNYRGQALGTRRPKYVLTYTPAGTNPKDSALVCSLFHKQYPNGGEAFVGKKGNIRFYLVDAEAKGPGAAKAAAPKA